MSGYVFVLLFLAVSCLWLFAKAHNERDEFAGLVGNGVAALGCLLAIGLGIQFGHPWLWIAGGTALAVDLVLLTLRIRNT
jgi:hypothetical protein